MSGSAGLFSKKKFFFYLVGSPKVGGAGDGKHKKKYGHPNSQRRINILVSTHIFSEVRNPIKALFCVLDHYNMSKHTTYTFQVVRHVPGSENHQIDYISGTGQRRINILVSTHILMWGEESNTFLCWVRNPINTLFSVLDHYNMLQQYTFQMVHHIPKFPLMATSYVYG